MAGSREMAALGRGTITPTGAVRIEAAWPLKAAVERTFAIDSFAP